MSPLRISVISAGRPNNVSGYMDLDCTWYVPVDQVASYKAKGAKQIVGVKGTLPMKSKQLNTALEDGFSKNQLVATVDDDIVKVICKNTKKSLPLGKVIERIAKLLQESDYYLAGPYSGLNTSWAPGIVNQGRIPGALMVHKPNDKIRFASETDSAEDLDYVIQHHVEYKGVVLVGDLCLQNEWSDNDGGFQDFRSKQLLEDVTKALAKRWENTGCIFKLDPSRKNGVNYRVPWKKLCQS